MWIIILAAISISLSGCIANIEETKVIGSHDKVKESQSNHQKTPIKANVNAPTKWPFLD